MLHIEDQLIIKTNTKWAMNTYEYGIYLNMGVQK